MNSNTSSFFLVVSLASSFLASLAIALSLPGSMPAQTAERTVYTMRREYDIKPQADGKTYLLRRFAKDGSTYETVPLTRVSQRSGETVYSDAGGKRYLVLSDGLLEEKIAAPTAPGPSEAPPADVTRRGDSSARPIEYQGRKGTIFSRSEATGRHSYLKLDGDSEAFEIQPVHGSEMLFTLAGRDGVYVVVDPSGKVTVADSEGRPRPLPGPKPTVSADTPPLPAQPPMAPVPSSQVASLRIEYEGRKGRIIGSFGVGGTRGTLFMEGESGALAVLESVRGRTDLFTLIDRTDVNVIVDSQGVLTATDSAGKPIGLSALRAIGMGKPEPAQVNLPPSPPAAPQPAPIAPSPPPVPAYTGPPSGSLECHGLTPQNGEQVFNGLPPAKLQLDYDINTWDGKLVPNGQTQRLILRNKKPGTQKKCTVHWKLAS